MIRGIKLIGMSRKMNVNKSVLPSEQMDDIEDRLAGTLRPVRPRRDFVRRLREHIRIPPRDEIVVRLHDWERLALVFGGVLSGAVFILTVARAMYHLVGRRNG